MQQGSKYQSCRKLGDYIMTTKDVNKKAAMMKASFVFKLSLFLVLLAMGK